MKMNKKFSKTIYKKRYTQVFSKVKTRAPILPKCKLSLANIQTSNYNNDLYLLIETLVSKISSL